MFAGLDYGTSNCSMGWWDGRRPRLVALETPGDSPATIIPSTLFAPRPEGDDRDRVAALNVREQPYEDLRFGSAAIDAYLAAPADGYYVKSPKSFLGARGLSEEVHDRFVAVVAAMIRNVRDQAAAALGTAPDDVVIGRPVNFQGMRGEDDNQRALGMLEAAAREAGFSSVAFQFEPMAAALEFESHLVREQTVLVIDIGGGTTDCSFVRVGPDRARHTDRDADVLGHSGERLGGNDYDQQLTLNAITPLLGFGSELKSGLPMPNVIYVDAISTNDVIAQSRFYSERQGNKLYEYTREARDPEAVSRLLRLHEKRLTYRLVRAAEQAKIALSEAAAADQPVSVDLGFLERGDAGQLSATVTQHDLSGSSQRLLRHLGQLIESVIQQAGTVPDAFYLTGGMARSPMVRAFLQARLPDAALIDSDHFASVTEGLTIWARRLFG